MEQVPRRRVEPEDVVAVFFAGHGVQISGLNYLLPRDVPPDSEGEELLKARSLRFFAKMMDDLADRKPRVNLLVIGVRAATIPFRSPDGKRRIGAERGLAPVDNARGTLLCIQPEPGNWPSTDLTDADPDPNSVYTRRLLPLLKQPGLSLVQIAKQVQGEVSRNARSRHVWNGQKISILSHQLITTA